MRKLPFPTFVRAGAASRQESLARSQPGLLMVGFSMYVRSHAVSLAQTGAEEGGVSVLHTGLRAGAAGLALGTFT